MHAIILAGGKGTRLAPYTDTVPKPLVNVYDRPLLEIIISQLCASGFTRITLCVSHFGRMIERVIGDGTNHGITIDYCWDAEPLGTVGPLRGVEQWHSSALVMNGDVLTDLDFAKIMQVHRQNDAVITLAVRNHEIEIGFGVVSIEYDRLVCIQEKPSIAMEISAGIQVMDPSVCEYIPRGKPMDMPSLIQEAIARDLPVMPYRFLGSWHDIGTPENLRRASSTFAINPQRYIAGENGALRPTSGTPALPAQAPRA